MKTLGILLGIAAVLSLLFGFNVDTTVSSELGRVHNIGLMSERQNIIICGAAMLVAAALLLAFSSRTGNSIAENTHGYRKCLSCAELVKIEATVCRHCQRDLPSLNELKAQEQVERQRLAEAEGLTGEAARVAVDLLPKGTCPNCNKIIPLASAECKYCQASFSAGSAWRVLPKSAA